MGERAQWRGKLPLARRWIGGRRIGHGGPCPSISPGNDNADSGTRDRAPPWGGTIVPPSSRHHRLRHLPVDVGEAEIASGVAEGELFVVEA